jgi:hypothetical protein
MNNKTIKKNIKKYSVASPSLRNADIKPGQHQNCLRTTHLSVTGVPAGQRSNIWMYVLIAIKQNSRTRGKERFQGELAFNINGEYSL